MSNLSQFFGGGGVKPTSIDAPMTQVSAPTSAGFFRTTNVNSGACTLNTLKTVLSVTGKGALTRLWLASVDTTSRTHRMKVTIDGVVVFDKTSSAVVSSAPIPIHGDTTLGSGANGPLIEGTPLIFDASLLIEYATSISETDKTQIGYTVHLRK